MTEARIKGQLRWPPKLHAAMTRLAKASRRSLNAEVVIAIEEHVVAAPRKMRARIERLVRTVRAKNAIPLGERTVRAKKGRAR